VEPLRACAARPYVPRLVDSLRHRLLGGDARGRRGVPGAGALSAAARIARRNRALSVRTGGDAPGVDTPATVLALLAALALAQTQPIPERLYLGSGLVIGSSRVVALSGASVGVAEGADSM